LNRANGTSLAKEPPPMLKLLTFLLALLGAVVIIVLSVDNRDIVNLVFWPLPFSYQMPLYAVFLIGLFAGALLGGTATWLSGQADRREARALRRKVRAVEYQDRLKTEREEQAALELARRKTQSMALTAPRA
jgi:putative membrane protein